MEKLYPERVCCSAFASRAPEECPRLYRRRVSQGHVLAERPMMGGQGTPYRSSPSLQLVAVETHGDVERYRVR